MKTDRIQFDAVRYTPENGAFETLVRIHDQGQVFSYPAQVAAPINADFTLIARRLTQAAQHAHKCASGQTRLHHAAPLEAAA